MQNKILSFIGLMKKAGALVSGEENCGKTCRAKKAVYIYLASDSSENCRKKAASFAGTGNVPLRELPFTKSELAITLNTGECALICCTDNGFSSALEKKLEEYGG